MSVSLILGNILSFIGIIFFTLSAIKNNKDEILIYQIIDCFFIALSNFVLGGFSGAVVILSSMVRNILVYKNKMNHFVFSLIVLIMFIFGLGFNQQGWIGTLPVIANFEYTWWLCYGDGKVKGIKIALAINVFIWAAYDLTILALPAFASDIIIFIITIYGLYKTNKSTKLNTLNNASIKNC